MKQLPGILCGNAPPFHIGSTLADNSNADNVAGSSKSTVLHSRRHIAAVSAAAGVLGAAAVASAATAAQAEAVSAPPAAAAAAAINGRAVLCLDHHVHPHGVYLSCFLRGLPRCSCLLPGSCHRPKGLQEALGYCQISSPILTESSPHGSSQPPHHSTQNYAFLQNNSKKREIEGKFHKEHVGANFLVCTCLCYVFAL